MKNRHPDSYETQIQVLQQPFPPGSGAYGPLHLIPVCQGWQMGGNKETQVSSYSQREEVTFCDVQGQVGEDLARTAMRCTVPHKIQPL